MNQHKAVGVEQSPTSGRIQQIQQFVLESQPISLSPPHDHSHSSSSTPRDHNPYSSQTIQLNVADTEQFDDDYIRSVHPTPSTQQSSSHGLLIGVFAVIVVVICGVGFAVSYQMADGSAGVDNRITAVFVAAGYNQVSIMRSIGDFMDANRQLIVPNPNSQSNISNNNSQSLPQITKIILLCNFTPSDSTLHYLKLISADIIQADTAINMKYIDTVLANITTPYFYFSTTDWVMKNSNYLQYSAKILRTNSKIVQITASDTIQYSQATEKIPIGFSFKPSLHRMSDYRLLKMNGRTGLAAIAGDDCLLNDRKCEDLLSNFFLKASRQIYVNKIYTILKQDHTGVREGSINTIKNKNLNPGNSIITQTNQDYTNTIQSPPPQFKITINKLEAINAMIKNSQRNRIQKQKQKQKQIGLNPPQSIPTPPIKKPISIDEPNTNTNAHTNMQGAKTPETVVQNLYVKNLFRDLRQAPQVTTLLKQQQPVYKQLPFCIIIMPNPSNSLLLQIITSVNQQKYKNYNLVNRAQLLSTQPYKDIQQNIHNNCSKNSILLFINHTLQSTALQYLNTYHQKYRTYFTYTRDADGNAEIYSMLARVYDLLEVNDFRGMNRKEIFGWNTKTIAVGVIQLGQLYGKMVQKEKIVGSSNISAHFSIYLADSSWATSLPSFHYQKLIKLSQDYLIVDQLYKKSYSLAQKSPYIGSQLNKSHLQYAIQRQQLLYLPQNHLISEIQYQYFSAYYKINLYPAQQQQRFCLTVISHNNIQNNRYKKLVRSIHQQVYSNYHVVFIDDFSSDGNLEATYEQFVKIGFDMSKITFVRNKMRNYATYNIINAAYSYCQENQSQVMIDGDDELIGKYALQVINSGYRSGQDTWLVYSNYKTSQFNYGFSRRFHNDSQHLQNNIRKPISFIGPIRTWKVKLICHIPLFYHKMSNGKWLDTVSDDAIQHPLLELATVKRVKYINEIMYEYNVKYGDNDDSSPQKVRYRKNVYAQLLKLKPLEPLESLNKAVKKAQVQSVLRADKGLKYETYQP